jgi:hypothetical protein
MLGGAAIGGSNGGDSNLQLATILANINAAAGTSVAQIDGSASTFTLYNDRSQGRNVTIGDRVLCTRQGSQMYEVAVVKSAAALSPYAHYGLTADQSIPDATITTVQFNVIVSSRVGFATPAAGVFTIPSSGTYAINAQVHFIASTATAGNNRRICMVAVNGTEITRNEKAMPLSVTTAWMQDVHSILPLFTGDTVEIKCYQNSGAAKVATAQSGAIYTSFVQLAKIN